MNSRTGHTTSTTFRRAKSMVLRSTRNSSIVSVKMLGKSIILSIKSKRQLKNVRIWGTNPTKKYPITNRLRICLKHHIRKSYNSLYNIILFNLGNQWDWSTCAVEDSSVVYENEPGFSETARHFPQECFHWWGNRGYDTHTESKLRLSAEYY
jgi:hypothetical protein